MPLLSSIRTFLSYVFDRSDIESDMDEEFRSHLRIRAEDLERQGVPKAEAERRARIEFGGYQRYKEECREALGTRLLQEFAADVRYGLRQLRRNPGFTAVAVLTLALGIGANTAIFSLIDAVMLRPLPVHDPSQLFVLRWSARKAPDLNGPTFLYNGCNGGCSFPYPLFLSAQSEKGVFSATAAVGGTGQLVLSGNGPAKMAGGGLVTGDYFSTLGVVAAIGRTLGPEDDSPSASPAVVLSHAFWKSAFGANPSVVGRTILLNSVPFTIAGVAEPGFTGIQPGQTQDFWLPIEMAPRLKIPWGTNMQAVNDWWWLVILARLKPGVTLGRAQAAASLAFRDEMLHGPKPLLKASGDPKIELVPAQQALTGLRGFYTTPLYILMFAVGLILLIACANVAGLLLSRAATREKEMAVRLAVGAGRWRIARQMLTESMMLSLAGGALGVLFAYWGIHAIIGLLSSGPFPFSFETAPDWRVLTFTILISLLTGIAFGLAPAFRSARLDLTPALKESAPSSALGRKRAGGRLHLGKTLVVVQIVLSMVVLVGAGLLVRTLQNLRDVDPGFDTKNLILFGIDPTLDGYKDVRVENLYRELQARLAALPGVRSASYSFPALLDSSLISTTFHIEGQPEKKSVPVYMLTAGPGFLSTMDIPLIGGRKFTAHDFQQADETASAERHASEAAKSGAPSPTIVRPAPPIPMLVNQAFVRKYFPGQNPLGERLVESSGSGTHGASAGRKHPTKSWEIIGIVGNTKYLDLREAIHPTVYVPITGGSAFFELRTAGDPAALIPSVRRVVEQMNKNLPLSRVATQSQSIDSSLMRERMFARLSGLFSLLALLLACIGLYGLLSYEVTRQTHEVGVRMALGAQRNDVLGMVVGQGLKLALAGVIIGVGGALALTRFLASQLYGIKPTDPVTFAAASLILLAVALLACYIPARRAAKVDPMVALRYE